MSRDWHMWRMRRRRWNARRAPQDIATRARHVETWRVRHGSRPGRGKPIPPPSHPPIRRHPNPCGWWNRGPGGGSGGRWLPPQLSPPLSHWVARVFLNSSRPCDAYKTRQPPPSALQLPSSVGRAQTSDPLIRSQLISSAKSVLPATECQKKWIIWSQNFQKKLLNVIRHLLVFVWFCLAICERN